MAHIRQHKEDFYSNFQVLSKSEDEVENLIECCAKYFEGGAYFTNSVDVCIPAIATTLGVNLNLFQKDPTTKLVTLTRYDCNEYNSSVNLFLHYYPGSKHGKGLDAHYNCYIAKIFLLVFAVSGPFTSFLVLHTISWFSRSEVCAFVWGIFVRGLHVETFVRVLRSSRCRL